MYPAGCADGAELRIADLYKGRLVELTASLALSAAQLSVEYKLPMDSSLILATARAYDATLRTRDEYRVDLGFQHCSSPMLKLFFVSQRARFC